MIFHSERDIDLNRSKSKKSLQFIKNLKNNSIFTLINANSVNTIVEESTNQVSKKLNLILLYPCDLFSYDLLSLYNSVISVKCKITLIRFNI